MHTGGRGPLSLARARGWGRPRGTDLDSEPMELRAARLAGARPAVILANSAEADLLDRAGGRRGLATDAFVEKRGGDPALVTTRRNRLEVPAIEIGPVSDSTGAGDAFAAGYLLARIDGAEAIECTTAGHQLAARYLGELSRREGGS